MRLELDLDGGQRLKESFLWDQNEPYLSLEAFAHILAEEHGLPSSCEVAVVQQMKKQIKDFRGYKIMTEQVPLSFIEKRQ